MSLVISTSSSGEVSRCCITNQINISICTIGNMTGTQIISTSTNSVTSTINVGVSPQGLALTPDGDYLYVANHDGDTISVICLSDNKEIAKIDVGDGPTCLGKFIGTIPTDSNGDDNGDSDDSDGDLDGDSGGGCFIATAALGS